MNYEKEIIIDCDALDLEWLEQPRLFMKYAKHSAQCMRTLDEAKERLDVAKAEEDKNIRENPEDYGIAKITEAVVQATILTTPAYKEANAAFIEAKYEADIARSAVNAFNQRKDALENLVRLHGQQYFAGPRVPRNIKEESDKRKEALNSRIANKLTRKNN